MSKLSSSSRRRRPFSSLAVLGAVLAGSFAAAPAQAANHPERKWLVKESAHFSLHYYPGLENTAVRILRSAEEAYPKLSADFGAQLGGRVPIIITHDSFFNGSAEPLKDRITLDPQLASSSVIGTQRFVAHELAHIMTFASVDKGNKMAKLSSLGGLPTWFLEGIAQYTTEYWYPSNDRMLRLHTLENTIMTDTERANFRMHGVHAGAAGYNEGYALCRYMFDTYGRDKIKVLMANLKQGKRTFEQAVEATFGTNLAAIQAGWKQSLRDNYKKQIQGLADQVPGSTKLISTYQGEVNVQPRLSPDGKKLAYLTSRYQDSFLYLRGNVMGFLSLYVSDPDGRNAQMIPVGKGAVISHGWSADGKQLVYSRVTSDAAGNPAFDLFTYDLESRKNARLTTNEYTQTMAWRPGKQEVVYVSVVDGQNTIKRIDTRTKKITVVLKAESEVQYKQPAWSPDGRRVALVTHKPGETGNLVVLDVETGKLSELTKSIERVDDSTPTWTPDGKHVVFTSDRGGMTNLYQVTVANRALKQLTNTFRGAEMPAMTPDGKTLYYTSYRSKGSEIYRLPLEKATPAVSAAPAAKPIKLAKATPEGPNAEGLVPAGGLSAAAKGLNASLPVPAAADTPKGLFEKVQPTAPDLSNLSFADAKPYQPTLTNDLLIPQMTSDEKGQQVGVAGMYSDILDKHQLAFDVRYGIMSSRFSYMLQYLNRMNTSSYMVSLYDQPNIGLSPDIGRNGAPLYDSLYFQRQRGVMAGLQTPLGAGRSLFTGVNMGQLTTLMDPRVGNYGQLREGQHNTVTLGYSEQNMQNTVDGDINPTDGYRVGASYTLSDSLMGSNFNYSQYLIQGERYFAINPEWRHNLTWRFNLGMLNGDAAVPFLLGGANATSPIYSLRGYSVGAFTGNRIATTGIEYTAPIFTHIDKQFGPLYLDRFYIAGFLDAGSAWNQGASATPFASTGLEFRLRTSVMGRQMLTFKFGLAQKLGSQDAPGFYLTF